MALRNHGHGDYMISRGLAKAGSREPYWADGTSQNRDTDDYDR